MVEFFPTPLASGQQQALCFMEKSIQPLGTPVYHLDAQGELLITDRLWDTGVCCLYCEQEPVVGISRARSMTVPRVESEAKPDTSLEQNVATLGRWSPGTVEDDLQSRRMSIRVPLTTLQPLV